MRRDNPSKSAIFYQLAALCLLLFAGSCTQEDYETGDGSLSFLRADFVEMRTNSSGGFSTATTDDGLELHFGGTLVPSWQTTPDSLYRMLLYYNKVEPAVKVVSMVQVHVPAITPASQRKSPAKTDPVGLESIWQSRGNKYINMGLLLKTGQADGQDNRQVIGLLCDTVYTRADGRRHAMLRFYHDQNSVPQYYTTTAYVSIGMEKMPFGVQRGDTITVTVNTYGGETARRFVY